MTDQELVTREILIHRAGEIADRLIDALILDRWHARVLWTRSGAGLIRRSMKEHRLYSKEDDARLIRIATLARHAATYALDAMGREA